MSQPPVFEDNRVVGMHFRPPEARALNEGLAIGDYVLTERETDNQYDANAIKVVVSDTHIGYIEASKAAWIAPWIDEGWTFIADVTDIVTVKNNNHRIIRLTPVLPSEESVDTTQETESA